MIRLISFIMVSLLVSTSVFAFDKSKRQERRAQWKSMSPEEREAKKAEMQAKWQEKYQNADADTQARMNERKTRRQERRANRRSQRGK